MEEPKPYQFGKAAAQHSPALLNAIDRLGDRLARRIRMLIEPLSGTRPIVKALPVDHTPLLLWDAGVPPFASLSLYKLNPIKGTTILRIDAPLISNLVDRFYGGSGAGAPTQAREFTPTESRLIERLSAQVMGALTECWAEHVTMHPMLIGRETAVSQIDSAGSDDLVVQGFEIDIGDKDNWTIEIVYPLDGLNAVEGVNAPRAVEEAKDEDPNWRRQLCDRLNEVRLPARTVLARPNLKMSELVALKAGDVINIHISRHLPLIIGDRVFAHGTIGEQDGRAAFMIEKLA